MLLFSVFTIFVLILGLTKHASILAHMFTLAEGTGISVPLFDQSQSQNNNMTNEVGDHFSFSIKYLMNSNSICQYLKYLLLYWYEFSSTVKPHRQDPRNIRPYWLILQAGLQNNEIYFVVLDFINNKTHHFLILCFTSQFTYF